MPATLPDHLGREVRQLRGTQSRKWLASSTSYRLRAVSVQGRNLLLVGGLRGGFKEEVTLNQILKDGKALQMQRKGGWGGWGG